MTDILLDPDPSAAAKSEQAVAHVDALPPGTRLAEFEVQGLLGVGGFGLVYRAYDHSLHRTVAIKEYMPAALAARQGGVTVVVRSSSDQRTYQSGLDSFVAEARLLAQFDHPSLVKVYRFWEANNTAYMVMPLYSGVTLKEARSQMVAPPPEAWLRSVLWSILQALHVLHKHDTLHRDVSPDNIFLQDMGPPVLLDLGASRRAISDQSHKLTAVLKVNFAPIEQYAETDDLKQGPWTDLYALAAVVYSCLRNEPPPPATARVVRDSMPSVRSVANTVKQHFGLEYSDEFVRTIAHALAVQPAQRPQSLAAFVTEMKLKSQPRLAKFDWRAELGASLLAEQEEHHSRQFWSTQPRTVPMERGQVARLKRRATVAATFASLRSGQLVALLGAVLVLGVAVYYGMLRQGGPARPPQPVAAPLPAAVQLPPPLPAASEPAAPAARVSQPSSAVVPAPGSARTPAASLAVAPPKAPASPPKAAPHPKPKSAAAHAESRKARAPAAAPAASPVQAPAVPKSGAAAAKPPAADAPLCPEANFFTRPMCIHLACEKPGNAQRPECEEDRQRFPNG